MPRQMYQPRVQPKATAKAMSTMIKALKGAEKFSLTHIEQLLNDSYELRYHYNGVSDDLSLLLNKPEYFTNHTDKSAETLYEKVSHTLEEILLTFPEYVAELQRRETYHAYREYIEELSHTHFEFNNAQYHYSSNEYEVNQNRAAWAAVIGNIFKNNPNRSIEWYQDFYTHLKNPDNFKLKLDAEESISISMHTSCWSYWATLETTFKGEIIKSGKCSYRDSNVNRL